MRYGVQFLATASTVVFVEADDPVSAMDAADQEFRVPRLCHHCAGEMDVSDWEADDSEHGTWEA